MARVRTRSGKVVRPRYEDAARVRGAVALPSPAPLPWIEQEAAESAAEDATARARFLRLCAGAVLLFAAVGVTAAAAQVYLVGDYARVVREEHARVVSLRHAAEQHREVLAQRGWSPRAYLQTLDDEWRIHMQQAKYDDAVRWFRVVVGVRGGYAAARVLRVPVRPPYAHEIPGWR